MHVRPRIEILNKTGQKTLVGFVVYFLEKYEEMSRQKWLPEYKTCEKKHIEA